jgi:hypothetical protein
MNGVDTPQHWTGAGEFANWAADSGTLSVGKYLLYHMNRLWYAEAALPSRVRYSGLTGTSPDTGAWDADNYVDFEPSDGQEITALAVYGEYILVFKSRKIYVIYDPVTGANRKLSDSVGTIAPRSVVETPEGLFFLDEEQGVMVTDGNSIERISAPVDPLLRTARGFPGQLEKAAGVYHDSRYFLSLSTDGSTNNRTLEFDLRSQSWWLHDCASNGFALVDPVGTPILYSADPNSIRVQKAFQENTWQDSGVDYAGGAYYVGPEMVWGAPHINKRVREVRIDGAGEWTLGYAIDHFTDFAEDAGEVWSTTAEVGIFAPPASVGELFAPTVSTGDTFAPLSSAVTDRRYYTLGVGRSWAFRFRNDDAGDFQIFSMTVATTGRTD